MKAASIILRATLAVPLGLAILVLGVLLALVWRPFATIGMLVLWALAIG